MKASVEVMLTIRPAMFSPAALSTSAIRQQYSNPINVKISQFGVEFLHGFRDRMQKFYHGEQVPDLGSKEYGYLYCTSPEGIGVARERVDLQRSLTLTTAPGKICQISNSRRATCVYDQRIELHGSAGMLRAANVLENKVDVVTVDAPTLNFFLERYEAACANEMKAFIAHLSCLRGGAGGQGRVAGTGAGRCDAAIA